MPDSQVLDDLLAAEVASWPTGSSAVVVVDASGEVGRGGDLDIPRAWASVTKVLTALTALQAAEAGLVDLDEPAGPAGATVAHLLAHASGLAADDDRTLAAAGLRRIYSNRGYELLAQHLEVQCGRPYEDLLREWVLDPVGMTGTRLEGSPAHGAWGPVADLGRLALELLAPAILPVQVVRRVSETAFPGLSGVLPGFGRQTPNDWALGCEVRDGKAPHWTSPDNHPTTFGHFGQAGSFVWVDHAAGLGCASAGDTAFGAWAAEAWPQLSTLVLDHVRRP
ncbi:MAG: beta-lactamase [Frankiales bacterium]|jgi:CubicO group peptidase (beta-lactamase class C family)|nr:beta-lactamase [Frankiales bacterium]